MTVSSSPDRNTWQLNNYLERCEQEGKEPNPAYIKMWTDASAEDAAWAESQPKNDLEYDLRSTLWVVNKARVSDAYAQNIYAALCNMRWQRQDVMPILKDDYWSCSWRSAGGVVADILGKGDYIDWYCSGICNTNDETLEDWTKRTGYVAEGTVTDEILADFAALGWHPSPWPDDKD